MIQFFPKLNLLRGELQFLCIMFDSISKTINVSALEKILVVVFCSLAVICADVFIGKLVVPVVTEKVGCNEMTFL